MITPSQISASQSSFDVAIVGGAGHVGLPLALTFASKNLRVLIYDINVDALEQIIAGQMPFMEEDADHLLTEVLATNKLTVTSDPSALTGVPSIIITIGTPIDEFMNSSNVVIQNCVATLIPFLSDDQLLILRSTVYPGTTEWLDEFLHDNGRYNLLAFCPERIVQGHAIRELQSLPQIVSAVTSEAEERATALFQQIAREIIHLTPREAEFAKLFNNAYRYVLFALANQFYTIAEQSGVDYYRVLDGMKKNYPRANDLPRAGFAAGPCLLKDTVHLTSVSDGRFSFLQAAIEVNEGMVSYLVDRVAKEVNLSKCAVGLLGMAFKADCDDTRNSLSYPLKAMLQKQAKQVLTTDPFVKGDSDLVPLEQVLSECDVLILCVPHSVYRYLKLDHLHVIDIWNYL